MAISEKQKKILAFSYTQKYQALICDGAVRSGKTSIMTVAFIDWAMREFNNTNFAICGKTVGSAIKNIVNPYISLAYAKKRYSIEFSRADNKITISQGNKSNTFYIYGGKDESSYMLIQGITLGGVLLDEVALMTRSFVEQSLARCLSLKNRRYWFNCNPENPNHWFYKEWILQTEKHKALHLHFLLEDNPMLDDETIQEASNMYSGVFYERYILGRWVAAEGAIYSQFIVNPSKYYIENPDFDFIQIGVDFGGNKSAHTFVATGLKNDYSTITALRSMRIEAAGTSPNDLYELLNQFIQIVNQEYGEVYCIYADSAEQTLINGMKSHVNISVRDSYKNPVIDRIRATTSLMSMNRFFYTKNCETLVEAFQNAVYDPKSIIDKRLDDFTSDIDTLDAFEYSWERYIKNYMRKEIGEQLDEE